MLDLNLISLCVMLAVLFVGGAFAAYRKLTGYEGRLEKALKQFPRMSIHSADPKFAFNAATATMVRRDDDQNNGEATTYAVTIHARNEFGEYFVFRSDGNAPSINHLDQRLAKIVLKHDYAAP